MRYLVFLLVISLLLFSCNKAKKHFKTANNMALANDLEGALSEYTQTIELSPVNANAYGNRGIVKLVLKDYVGAHEDLNKAVTIRKDPKYLYARAITHENLSNYVQAIEDYDEVLKVDPHHANAFYKRGIAKNKMGFFNWALIDFDSALNLTTSSSILYDKGLIYDKINDFGMAIEYYTKVIEENPLQANAFHNRANKRFYIKEFESALNDYNKAIELDSENALFYTNRAILHYYRNRFDMALEDINLAIKLDPLAGQPLYFRGLIKSKSDDVENAILDFQKSGELGFLKAFLELKKEKLNIIANETEEN